MITWKPSGKSFEGYFEDKVVAFVHWHGNLTSIVYPTGKGCMGYMPNQITNPTKDEIEGKWWCEQNFDPEVFRKGNLKTLCYSETHKRILMEKQGERYKDKFARRLNGYGELSKTDIVEYTMPVNGIHTWETFKAKYEDAINLGQGYPATLEEICAWNGINL